MSDLLARRMRAQQHDDFPRCWGRSSDALALYAVTGTGRPVVPGREESRGSWRGSECSRNCPNDPSDLLACELTFDMADPTERVVMLPVLIEFRGWVLDGLNRYGERALCRTGYRERVFAMDEWAPYRERWNGSPAAPEDGRIL